MGGGERPSTASTYYGGSCTTTTTIIPVGGGGRRAHAQHRTLPDCRPGCPRATAPPHQLPPDSSISSAGGRFSSSSDMDAHDCLGAHQRPPRRAGLTQDFTPRPEGLARRDRSELRGRRETFRDPLTGDRPCRKRRIQTAAPGGRPCSSVIS